MFIHHYDPATGEIVSSQPATPQPLEGGYISFDHTFLSEFAVPAPPPQMTVVYRDGKVTNVPDCRGVRYYTANDGGVEITDLGVSLPEDSTTDTPPTQYHALVKGAWVLTAAGKAKQLADAIAAAQAASSAQAEQFREQFASAPALRVIGWSQKTAALQVLAVNPKDEAALAIFAAEASMTGEAVQAVVEKSRARAVLFASAIGVVEGMERVALRELGACTSLDALDATKAALQARADGLKAQLAGA